MHTQESAIGDDQTEYQEHQAVEESQSQGNQPTREEAELSSVPNAQSDNSLEQFELDGTDLPDLEALLSRPSSDLARKGVKRRKTSHSYSWKARIHGVSKGSNASGVATVTPVTADGETGHNANITSRIPTSPVSVNSDESAPVRPRMSRFRMPRGLSPIERLDEALLPRRLHPSADSSPASNTGLPASLSREGESCALSGGTNEESDKSQDDDVSLQMRQVRRRIKGVLPASWLKLDKQNKPKSSAALKRKAVRRLSPDVDVDRPGVARKKASLPKRTPLTLDLDSASDVSVHAEESNQEMVRTTVPSDTGPAMARSRAELGSTWPIDVVEEDTMDMMLPFASKRSIQRNGKPRRKYQTRISDFETHPLESPYDQTSKASHSNRSRGPRTVGQSGRHVNRGSSASPKTRLVPRLGILDAPKSPRDAQRPVPRFISIAQRQARSQASKGRHSPLQKAFRLASQADTMTVNSILQDWQDGKIMPDSETNGSKPRHRIALQDQSSNQQRRFPTAGPRKSTLNRKNAPKRSSRLLKPVSRQTTLRNMAESSHPVIEASKFSALPKPSHDKPGFIFPWQLNHATMRPAQLQSTTTKYRDASRYGTLSKRLSYQDCLYEQQRRASPTKANPPLRRFLAAQDRLDWGEQVLQQPADSAALAEAEVNHVPQKKTRRPRKRSPQHLDADTAEYRQPEETFTVTEKPPSPPTRSLQNSILLNLGPFGTKYSCSFDVSPLQLGTFFHSTTFVGSGELSRALRAGTSRNMHQYVDHVHCQAGPWTFRWGPWNDKVALELNCAFDWATETFKSISKPTQDEGATNPKPSVSQLRLLFRFVIRYINDSLTFSDEKDREDFASRCTGLLQRMMQSLAFDTPSTGTSTHTAEAHEALIAFWMYCLVLASQVVLMLQAQTTDWALKDEATDTLNAVAKRFAVVLNSHGPLQLQSFYEKNKRLVQREAGIRDDDFACEGWVVLLHVLDTINSSLWEVVNSITFPETFARSTDVLQFEYIWHSMFVLLPLFDIDEYGVLDKGRRVRKPFDNWLIPRSLATHLFTIYMSTGHRQPPNFNAYCRIVFGRCHCLIKDWGWQRCESIIGIFFDFFAANNLSHLRHEETHGSPRFLEELDRDQALDLEPGDRCYHIFLKVIGVGIRGMRKVYPDKKIRNIVFRFMPNHGRQYPKEESIRHEDLESLRNHHDLLTTLYWVSTPSCRPSVNKIRDLVHAESSHRQACHISIKTWTNLVRFQLTTGEPSPSLDVFREWHSELTMQMLRQRRLARSEAQAQFASVTANGGAPISTRLLESTINNNQRQTEAILHDALASMATAISSAKNAQDAQHLLHKTSTADVLELFEAGSTRVNKLVSKGLEIVRHFVHACKPNTQDVSQQASTDSQDYGDWSAFEEAVATGPDRATIEHVHSTVHEALARLLSNAFGSDVRPQDAMLVDMVDTWVSVAGLLVRQCIKQWDNYVGSHSRYSWSSLRKTDQTRQYSGYFQSRLIEEDPECYKVMKLNNDHDLSNCVQTHEPYFMQSWIHSLVERDPLLMFQHQLTATILNADLDNPLLRNLPFWTKGSQSRMDITSTEFFERRLSVLSCKSSYLLLFILTGLGVFSNMREALEEAEMMSPNKASAMRREYVLLLKSVMSAMKGNYQELDQDRRNNGTYIDFVQRVVEFLQQYTIDICPVDKFFTDSTAFPLPATDPTYVVGRLKHYGIRLAGPRVHKQLVSFLQSVSERAAVDKQQPYLVSQLRSAMSGTYEAGLPNKPTLRAFLSMAVFPAYIEVALNAPTGWIISRPVIEAIGAIFRDLIQDVDSTKPLSVESAAQIVTSILDTMRQAVGLLVDQSGLLDQAFVLSTLSTFYTTITSSLPLVNYIHRLSGGASHAADCITFFRSFATFVTAVISNEDDVVSPHTDMPDFSTFQYPFPEVRRFCLNELREALRRNWVRHEDAYYLVRGNIRKEVAMAIADVEQEKDVLQRAMTDFEWVLDRMTGLGGRGRRHERGTRAMWKRNMILATSNIDF